MDLNIKCNVIGRSIILCNWVLPNNKISVVVVAVVVAVVVVSSEFEIF